MSELDLITLGRSTIDLYSSDVGSPFEDISAFSAYVGGSPLNIAVGTRRLGMNSAVISGVGQDKPADFVLKFLREEGVVTDYMFVKPGHRTSAVLLGVEPPDKFPLVYYRDNCADREVTIDDITSVPIAEAGMLEISGTALSHEPCRSATFFAAEQAKRAGVPVILDIDFRADQWHDVRAFGLMTRAILPLVDISIGTEEEINAAMLTRPEDVTIKEQQISAPEIRGDTEANIEAILSVPSGPELLVVKRGALGATLHPRGGEVTEVPGFPVEIYNVLGAGDAFASGFIYGLHQGWEPYKAARVGNACGAIVVTRHGCANFMGFEDEVLEFVEARGGF